MALSAQEAAVYDRQIRMWGVEKQQRLRGSSVLVVGMSATIAEACKNMVLAGVGSITILDDGTPIAQLDVSTNFLAAMSSASLFSSAAAPPHTAPPSSSSPSPSSVGVWPMEEDGVAERLSLVAACVTALRDFNPMVRVDSIAGSLDDIVSGTVSLDGFSALLLGTLSRKVEERVGERCRQASPPLPLASAACVSCCGRILFDLGTYSWTEKAPNGRMASHTITYPPVKVVHAVPISECPSSAPAGHYAFHVFDTWLQQQAGQGCTTQPAFSSVVAPEANGGADAAAQAAAGGAVGVNGTMSAVQELASRELQPAIHGAGRMRRRRAAAVAAATDLAEYMASSMADVSTGAAAGAEAAVVAPAAATAGTAAPPADRTQQLRATELPSVAAVVGGVAAQELVRFLSGSGVNVDNLFYFDSESMNGTVVRIGDPVGTTAGGA